MRRFFTSLLLAGSLILATSSAAHAQRGGGHAGGFSGGHAGGLSGGHAGGFGGGHVGGFSGGGFSSRGFGGGFAGPSGGYASHYFPAPRMNFSQGMASSGASRFAARPYGTSPATRSPFGQLSIPAVRRGPYPGAYSGAYSSSYSRSYPGSANNRSSTGQANHGGDHDGHDHYRRSYYGGTAIYSPYYANGLYWPWPYFGDWDSGYDDSADTTAAPAQNPDQNPGRYPDQDYAPEPQPEDMSRPAYPPAITGSPGVAISEPTVTIIYKDGHAEQVHNYALTRAALLMMDNASAGYSLLVPLELIDLPATEQINRAAGVDFRPPVQN